MAVIDFKNHVSWEQDYAERINPELMTGLLQQAVPVLQWTNWRITKVAPGYCESLLPLSVQTTNQHGTHQAALISLSADYTGGMALTTLLTGTPLTGIHRGAPSESASLWLASMDVKYENPSTSHLRAVSRVDEKTTRQIQSRYFAGRVVLATIHVEFFSECGQRVAVAIMRYFAQSTQKLLEQREGGERSPMANLNLKTSARIIAGLRAMGYRRSVNNPSSGKSSTLRIDTPHDHVAAGTHGMLQATRLQKVLPQLSAMIDARTRHCDQTVTGVAGIEQLVMVGAGLDMRPLRLAEHLRGATVFELDLPEMLAERESVVGRLRGQLRDSGARFPERHLISADFLVDDVGEKLQNHPAFSETALTVVIFEGCSMYFSEERNQRILKSLRARLRHPQSRLWMDCVTPAVISESTSDERIHDFVNQMELIGEKFIYGPSDTSQFLADCGLVQESRLTAGEFLNDDDPTLAEYGFLVGKRDVVELGGSDES